MTDSAGLATDLERAFVDDERPPAERRGLLRLMTLLVDRPAPPDPLDMWPDYADLRSRFLSAVVSGSADTIEERFLALYCHLHGYEAPYTHDERRRMDELGGYWCHAGGLSPLLKAADHIGPQTVSADFGAGNGLQGLLLQKLYPHARTVQIELSSRMVAAGRVLQDWLDIAPERVEWIVGDVLDHSPRGLDFVYLYRPVRPEGAGRRFYEQFAAELDQAPADIVIFSIADCLKSFLDDAFEAFYYDGHLTCFRRRARSGRNPGPAGPRR